ncbi:hypothetical protein QBC35DRAFT_450746 [Podospora australis]|uniref:Uncharacterized protein n=1 Tax=Podospora australis TaxID=1536484 RepID=A0AAN7AHN4_9PEZI|nr:hypothetical protein QBC35DRAFT_450746 [Podospora australis]
MLKRSISYHSKQKKLLDSCGPLYRQPAPVTPESAGSVDLFEDGEYWYHDEASESSTETETTASDLSPASSWSRNGCFEENKRRSGTRRKNLSGISAFSSNISQISPSTQRKPITIGISSSSRSSVDASIPVLSARGDIQGGYFPLHEDPRTRIITPHPFQKDAEMAHENSVKLAAEFCRDDRDTISGGDASVDAFGEPYNHDSAALYHARYANAPYYPSNYPFHGDPPALKASSKSPTPLPLGPNAIQNQTPSTPAAKATANRTTKVAALPSRARPTKTTAKPPNSKLQYEKQMARHYTRLAAKSAATTAISDISAIARREAFWKGSGTKPASPRLAPQKGSPGPMTPMSLEGDAGYLSRGRAMTPLDAQRIENELARANRLAYTGPSRQGSQHSLSCFR